jgi:TRAP-type C4-dicarboxylate transport system substrate-binding protein
MKTISICPMIKRTLILLGVMAVLTVFTPAAAETASAPTVVIKIATLAPSGSPYHEIMQEMAAGWREQSDNRVELRIYPGGVAGDEVDILRKIRIGQIDAGALSLSGLSRTLPEISVLGTPMIYKTRQSLLQVQDALDSKIEERMEKRGFVVLSWAIAGWVRFFVPEAEPSIAGLKKARMHVFAGDDQIMELWKTMGFNAIALPGTDVLPGLQSGMVNAFFTTPVMAYASQWFAFTPYMIDMPWAPMIGAIVVSKRGWEKVPEQLRPKLKAIAEEKSLLLDQEMQRLESEAISEMQKRGLTVVKPDAQQLEQWHSLTKIAYPQFKSKNNIPDEWFETALSVTQKKGS